MTTEYPFTSSYSTVNFNNYELILKGEYNKLKQENEKLKKELETLKKQDAYKKANECWQELTNDISNGSSLCLGTLIELINKEFYDMYIDV